MRSAIRIVAVSGFNGLRRPAGKAWIANVIDPGPILAEARRARSAGADIVVVSLHWGNEIARQSDAHPARHEGVMPRFTFTELASGRWAVTKVDAIATWIDVSPRIRVIDLAAAIADPATPSSRRDAYGAAHRRFTGYVRSRGASVSLVGPG
jgi:poly-gamma-glutamate synthesis protein (capsule biosynthesis protein)